MEPGPPREAGEEGRILVALAVVERAGEILVARRRAGEHLEGLWEFPGGKVLPGEKAEAAARRECLEELGFDPGPAAPLTELTHDYPDRRLRLVAFLARRDPREPGPSPAAAREWRWVPAGRLSGLEMPPANRAIVARLLEALR